jgi:hypothetical protein
MMKKCRDCQRDVSEQAMACPQCGCPYPAKEKWDGWGIEYKSAASIGGLPLVHIAFKYRTNRMPVVAKGVLAIGQVAVGIITIAQFGIGVISISQFTFAVFALAQCAVAGYLIAQFGLYVVNGTGQFVAQIFSILPMCPLR